MKLIPLITAILVTGFLYFLVPQTSETADGDAQTDDAEQANVIRVIAIKSEARQIDSAVILRGQTEATRSVQVRAQTSGQVVSEPLRKGTFVNADQLLCQIDVGTRDARA